MYTTELYFESHVTLEPVFDERLTLLKILAKSSGFHVAKLIMKKRKGETPSPNQEDAFCTARSVDYNELLGDIMIFIGRLQKHDFKVYRYKIENTLLDSRSHDPHDLIKDD